MRCPVSGDIMQHAFSLKVCGRYNADYFYCNVCGLLKIGNPFWINDLYKQPIDIDDTGILKRNIFHSYILELILWCMGLSKGKMLDVGGGYGVLARLMRDKGYDCYTVDKYCVNIFAKGFEPDSNFKADILFAFEVMEHLEDPKYFLEDIFFRYGCKSIIISTLTFKGVPSPDWWYYAIDSGKHITFYQERTLHYLAGLFGCNYYSINKMLHIITDLKIPCIKWFVLKNRFMNKIIVNFIQFYRVLDRRGREIEDSLKVKELIFKK